MHSFCKCKSYSHFVSKNISVYAIFNDPRFTNTFTNDMVSFEQLGPGNHDKIAHMITGVSTFKVTGYAWQTFCIFLQGK